MRSRSMSLLLPAIAFLCACILPAGASAQPVPAIPPPTAVQPMVVGVDLGAQDATVFAYVDRLDRYVFRVRTVDIATLERDYAPRDPSAIVADARVPTVPGVTVGGGSSG